jgi:hypothetical protein
VLKEMVGSDGKLGEMKIDMKFTKAALERYDELNKNPDFMTARKGPGANVKLLDLLELDIECCFRATCWLRKDGTRSVRTRPRQMQ